MHHSTRTTLRSLLIGMLLCLPAAVMAAPVNDTFDHFTTGFPLTGGHRSVECDACHTAGQFRGTPRECASCHNLLTNTGAVVKSSGHIQASNDCETCHSTLAWDDVRRVNHMAVLGNCKSCHTVGGTATSTPPSDTIHTGVISRGTDCIECHRTSTWVSVHFNHASAGTACTNCHSLSPSDIAATPPPVNTLHNDTIAAGFQCYNCHSVHSWGFSHGAVSGKCSDCHNNVITTGKSASHFVTALECNACHSTRAWTPASFGHQDSSYPPDHGWSSSCDRCHSGSPQSDANVYVYDYGSQTRTCIDCHYNDFRKQHSDSKLPAYQNCLVGCHEHSMRKF